MAKIKIKGPIIQNSDQWIYDWFGIDATSPRSVEDALADADGDDIEVDINSGGGDVFAGSEIYTELKSYAGKVTTRVVGLAASAASVIAMAGDQVLMSPTSQIMIHNAWSMEVGDYRDMRHESDVLKNVNKTIANAYRIKSGLDEAKLLKMMDDETWLSPQQALELHFADEVMFEDDSTKLVASAGFANMLPVEVINKIRNMHNPALSKEDEADIFMRKKAQAKLQLLNLRSGMNE